MLQAKPSLSYIPRSTDVEFCYADAWLGSFRLIAEQSGAIGIWNVSIDSRYRNMGLGTQMIKECVEFLRENYPRDTLIFLWVESTNLPAIKSYQKNGFYFTPDLFYQGSTVKRMEIKL